MTMKVVHRHIFLENCCDQLEASNKKQIKKRAIRHKFTSHRGIFGSREDGQDDVVVEDDGESEDISLLEVPEEPPVEPALPSMPMVRRQVTCSGCGIKGHTYVKCPTRIKWQNLSYFCGISRGEKLKVF